MRWRAPARSVDIHGRPPVCKVLVSSWRSGEGCRHQWHFLKRTQPRSAVAAFRGARARRGAALSAGGGALAVVSPLAVHTYSVVTARVALRLPAIESHGAEEACVPDSREACGRSWSASAESP